jgi:hypothetical protein
VAQRGEAAALVVVGPSGCGKSSLVRAGLVPVMAEEPGWWTLGPMLPGADPVAALVREFAAAARQVGLDWTVEEVRHRLDEAGLTEVADELLLAAPGGRRRLLVVVDQFEELLTQAAPAARARFAGLLGPALSGPVQVVATLRPEFLTQLLVDPELASLPTRTVTLRPLRSEALRAVIEGPAGVAGIGVDEELVARLVADTDTGEALPLLAFTLAQLAEGVDRGGQLSTVLYEQIGGLPMRRCCPPGPRWPRRSPPRDRRWSPAAPSSTPPPNGTSPGGWGCGCGNAANSPPLSLTPAPGSTPVADPAGCRTGGRGDPGCWSPIASPSVRTLASFCSPVSAAIAAGGGEPSPSCRCCSFWLWPQLASPPSRCALRIENAMSRCLKGSLPRSWNYAPPTQP